MTHALVTIIAPLAEQRVTDAETAIDALGNPPRPDVIAALDRLDGRDGTHFCSLHAVRSKTLGRAYLAFEFSADGTPDEATARIARAIGRDLASVFALASDWTGTSDITAYLGAHRITTGVGLLDNPGVAFAGTPDMSVGRIRDEQRLAARAAEILTPGGEARSALEQLKAVRDALSQDPQLVDMLETGVSAAPFAPPGLPALIGKLALSFIATYLWPLVVLVLLLAVADASMSAGGLGARLGSGLSSLVFWGGIALVVIVAAAAALYFELRSLEARDSTEDRVADPATLAAMLQRENHYAQNHMISVTQRKPGLVRWFTARLVFWVIGQLVTWLYRPGFLSDIGTIHFARWVTVPGTHDVLFFSNFDASWESYLEDFITKAHAGLTGVWSNSIGFPATENLFQRGATDGERFKRYARQSMFPTRFWYSGYPALTTDEIRTNTAIRLGLSGALTEDEAMRWLALFGSAARPETKLVTSEIQSIIFGGLGRDMPCGACLFYDVPPDLPEARAWLASLLPLIGFNDGRRLKQKAIVTLALGPEGLRRLGLPQEGLDSFPYSFLTGQTEAARSRILGDTGASAVAMWRWGQTAPQAALLAYGKSAEDVDALETSLAGLAEAHGAQLRHRVGLRDTATHTHEPFGFADGISQPVIRGTYKGLKAPDPIHLVEPGEFILGYPDNRGNRPPGPTLPSTADPRNILPLVQDVDDFTRNVVDGVRDIGRNGSYLVIRELEQDVDAFQAYCREQAEALQGRLPEPYEVTPEFIGSRLVGRWQNGSSTVRHPYLPKADKKAESKADASGATERPTTAETPPVARPAKQSHLQDNDFLFGTEDPEAVRCPFGSHIRRANPRDSLSPGSQDQIDISNRHRIIRIGRQYEPASAGAKPGLFFMCLNGDIERQFEFVQQTWLRRPSFHGLSGEQDPVLGDAEKGMCNFTIPTRYGPIRLAPVPAMVATRGGGYFFLPGRRLLEFLAADP